MGFEEIRKKNAARKQQLQSRQQGLFIKWANDKDVKLVKLVPPFEGFDREVNQKDGTSRTRQHYRMHVLGECNFKTGEGASVSTTTIEDVRKLKTHEAKLTTAPQTMSNGISESIDDQCTILCIVRNGVANSKETTYSVMGVVRLQDKELKVLTPKLSKEDIMQLESEETWADVSAEEREAYNNLSAESED